MTAGIAILAVIVIVESGVIISIAIYWKRKLIQEKWVSLNIQGIAYRYRYIQIDRQIDI